MGNPLTSVKRRGSWTWSDGRLGEIMSSKNCPPKNIRVFGLFLGGEWVLSLMFFFLDLLFEIRGMCSSGMKKSSPGLVS